MANQIATATGTIHSSQPRVTGTTVGADHGLDVNVIGGSITASLGGSPLVDVNWDYCDIQQTNATTETYVFKSGGSGGTTVATCVVVYTSSLKSDLDTVTWS